MLPRKLYQNQSQPQLPEPQVPPSSQQEEQDGEGEVFDIPKVLIFLVNDFFSQTGQVISSSILTRTSNSVSQSLHLYSYIGISILL